MTSGTVGVYTITHFTSLNHCLRYNQLKVQHATILLALHKHQARLDAFYLCCFENAKISYGTVTVVTEYGNVCTDRVNANAARAKGAFKLFFM